jgi:hypothetical protein
VIEARVVAALDPLQRGFDETSHEVKSRRATRIDPTSDSVEVSS